MFARSINSSTSQLVSLSKIDIRVLVGEECYAVPQFFVHHAQWIVRFRVQLEANFGRFQYQCTFIHSPLSQLCSDPMKTSQTLSDLILHARIVFDILSLFIGHRQLIKFPQIIGGEIQTAKTTYATFDDGFMELSADGLCIRSHFPSNRECKAKSRSHESAKSTISLRRLSFFTRNELHFCLPFFSATQRA